MGGIVLTELVPTGVLSRYASHGTNIAGHRYFTATLSTHRTSESQVELEKSRMGAVVDGKGGFCFTWTSYADIVYVARAAPTAVPYLLVIGIPSPLVLAPAAMAAPALVLIDGMNRSPQSVSRGMSSAAQVLFPGILPGEVVQLFPHGGRMQLCYFI